MAYLNELGRNSASISYGPYTNGQDIWATFQTLDTWLRGDTWAGYCTASGTSLTGVNTFWTTQARVGDTIMVAGIQKVIASIVSDTSMTVTVAFSSAITIPSAVKVINLSTYNNVANVANTTATGTVQTLVRTSTKGTVSVTSAANTSTTINGVGTYFLSEATNSVTLVSVNGTVAMDAYGVLTGTGTQWVAQQGTQAGLYPGDYIAILVGTAPQQTLYYFQIDQVNSDTSATVTQIPPYGAIGAGAVLQKATNGIAGRSININGRVRTITSITSNTVMTVTPGMDFTDSNLKYKVYPRGQILNSTSTTLWGSTAGTIASSTLTVAATLTGYIIPGCAITGAAISAGTVVTGQITGVGSPATTQTATGLSGSTTLTMSSTNTSVLVGHFVSGATGVTLAGIDLNTYVVSVSGTTVILSKPMTANVTAQTVNFWVAGGTGTYTTNGATPTAASGQIYFSTVYGVNANFAWDLVSGDQVWIGDELRTLHFSNAGNYGGASAISGNPAQPQPAVPIIYNNATQGQGAPLQAYTLDYIGYAGTAINRLIGQLQTAGVSFRRDDTNVIGLGTSFATDLRVNDDILIEGMEGTIASIYTNTQAVKLNQDFSHTTFGASIASTQASSTPSAGQNVMTPSSLTNIAVGQIVTGPGLPPNTLVYAINSPTTGQITLDHNFVAAGNTTTAYNFYAGVTMYKRKKLHGYVLEGAREGTGAAAPGNYKWATSTTILATAGTNYPLGTTTITVASGTGFAQWGLIKIQGAGGPPLQLTGQIVAGSATTTLTGTGTLFTTQLYIGAEIIVAGQYLTIATITSDTVATVTQTYTTTFNSQLYRSVPLYTVMTAVSGAVITLATPIKNTLYSTGANPPLVYTPSTTGDFVEFVYSCTNISPEINATNGTPAYAAVNQSLDRKYVGFRFWPYLNSNFITTGTATFTAGTYTAAQGGYATPVYERWAAGYAGTGGVGINLADTSGGTMMTGVQATTSFTITQPIAGALVPGMILPGSAQPNTVPLTTASGTWGQAGSVYTVSQSNTISAGTVVIPMLGSAVDVTQMTMTTGGFIYLFASNRYMLLQGKSFANVQQQWVGCVEFERAQPEDSSTGLGTTSTGISFQFVGTQAGQGVNNYYPINPVEGVIQQVPGIAPWPCYAYFNGNRFPVGASQVPSLPAPSMTYAVHGSVLATPRVRNSAGDLVGFNAHVYSAMTITTGRWGHQWEIAGTGAYASVAAPSTGVLTNTAHTLLQPHMGQIVPVYTNVYNSKRFMFSPVVVLGPSYDPDVRGRLYGLKVIPSGLGTLMDTVSITVDNSWFYTTNTQTGTDHWVIGTPPTTAAGIPTTNQPGTVLTWRLQFNNAQLQQSYRSLEDVSGQSVNTVTYFTNNFRWAIPA